MGDEQRKWYGWQSFSQTHPNVWQKILSYGAVKDMWWNLTLNGKRIESLSDLPYNIIYDAFWSLESREKMTPSMITHTDPVNARASLMMDLYTPVQNLCLEGQRLLIATTQGSMRPTTRNFREAHESYKRIVVKDTGLLAAVKRTMEAFRMAVQASKDDDSQKIE